MKQVATGFLFCPFPRAMLLPLVENLNDIFWKILNIPTPTTNLPDIRLGDLPEVCQKLTHHSPIWIMGPIMECYWNLTLAIWEDRNIKDIDISFKPVNASRRPDVTSGGSVWCKFL